MNDKQKLAAMGEHMAEQAAQPLCMAKRIEELEAQVRVMAELLRDLHEHIGTSIPQTVSEYYRGCDLLERIDAALAGNLPIHVNQEGWQLVPEPAVAEGRKPSLTGVNGIDAEFSVKFPSGFDGDPEIRFQSLCIDGDGVGGGQHICAMLAAANWLIDKAEWYRKGSAVINQPCAMFAAAPSPDGTI